MSNKKLTVVVCTKNEEKYIEPCLKKLVHQKVRPEIIVIDGHSKDNTIKIAKKYADMIKTDDGKGLAEARNLGWKLAKTELVAYCDADSRPYEDWTKDVIELLEKYEAVSGPFKPYDGGLKQKIGLFFWADISPIIGSFFRYNSIWGANMAFRRYVLEKHPFKLKFLEDYELGRRLRINKYKMIFTGKIRIEASSRRFNKSFHRFCFKEYLLNAIRINMGKTPKSNYWKKK